MESFGLTWLLALLIGVLPSFALADAPPKKSYSYDLRNLKAVSFSIQRSGNALRQFFQFQNEKGNHYLVYEEAPQEAGLREIYEIKNFFTNPTANCVLSLECKQMAFCANDCKSLYYEVTNSINDPNFADKNNCVIKSFGCLINGVALPAPNAPAPTPAPVAAAAPPTSPPAPATAPSPSPLPAPVPSAQH